MHVINFTHCGPTSFPARSHTVHNSTQSNCVSHFAADSDSSFSSSLAKDCSPSSFSPLMIQVGKLCRPTAEHCGASLVSCRCRGKLHRFRRRRSQKNRLASCARSLSQSGQRPAATALHHVRTCAADAGRTGAAAEAGAAGPLRRIQHHANAMLHATNVHTYVHM